MSISTIANRTLAEQAVTLLNHSNSSANAGTTLAASATAKGGPGKTDRGPAAIVDISALSAIFESKGQIPTLTMVSASGQFVAYPPPGETVEVETRSEFAGKVVEKWGPNEGKLGFTEEQFLENWKKRILEVADMDERGGLMDQAASLREVIATRTPKVMRPDDVQEISYKCYERKTYNTSGHLIESFGSVDVDFLDDSYRKLYEQNRLFYGEDSDFGDYVIVME